MKYYIILIIILFVQQVSAFVPFSLKWATNEIPLAFYIQPSVGSADNATIQDGYMVWTMVETTFFEFYYGGTRSNSVHVNDGINVNSFGTAYQIGNSLAVTWWWIDGTNMVDADIEFNSAVTWGGGGYDLKTVAIHEAGHVLGLNHEEGEESIMQPDYFGTQHELFQDDIDGISSIYPGRKTFTSDELYQNAPNPFLPNTTNDYTVIGYSVKDAGSVKIEIYNLAGELVKVLVDEHKDQGEYIGTRAARWYGDNGSVNTRGEDAASGVYIVALKTPRTKVKMRKIMLIR